MCVGTNIAVPGSPAIELDVRHVCVSHEDWGTGTEPTKDKKSPKSGVAFFGFQKNKDNQQSH